MKQIIYVSSEELGLTINITPDHVLWDHVVLLDLVDRFALPEFFHLVRKSLLLCSPVVLVKNLLSTLLVLNVSFSFIQELILWNRSSLWSLHASTVSCLCDVEWVLYVVHQPASNLQWLKLLHLVDLVEQQSDCIQNDHVLRKKLLTCGVLKFT